MGKNGDQSTRARIATMQAAQRRAEQRRRWLIVGGVAIVIIALIVSFVVIASRSKTPAQGGSRLLPASVAHDVTSVPPGTLAQVGTGSLAGVSRLPVKPISDQALASSGGKPQMLYIGAEFCPYCAAMRWSMAVALSRFGDFGPVRGIHSASSDIYPNTATLTFYKQRYSSPYLTFTPVENATVDGRPLQPTTRAQQAVWTRYDSAGGSPGYPFVYFGGKVIMTGPLYSPGVLKDLTWSQIAGQFADPGSAVARSVLGAANYVTASICKMTGDTPARVCKATPIPAIESKL